MTTPPYQVIAGDCRVAVRGRGPFDAVVTDPPYELGFMGRGWDRTAVAFQPATWAAIGAAMKPGAHLLAFGAPRTWHRLACAVEDAGFELRDQLCWLSAHRMPKGKGQLKPCWEPILVARKPLIGTEAANVAAHGTGLLQTDDCRIPSGEDHRAKCASVVGIPLTRGACYAPWEAVRGDSYDARGRWPANVLLDEEVAAILDAHTGTTRSRKGKPRGSAAPGNGWGSTRTGAEYDDAGGASRFFFVGRATVAEKQAGLVGLVNDHPTVKPLALMRWLLRLATPAGGLVLDPFCGSGSTGCAAALEGYGFVGMDTDPRHVDISRQRIAHWAAHLPAARAA
jgi:DNA methylase